MNEEYAIEPTAIRSALELQYILEKFGFSHGRFLAAYPRKWVSILREKISTFPDIEKSRAIYILEKYAANCVFRCGLEYFPEQRWVENASPHVKTKRFEQIFTARKEFDYEYPCIDDFSDESISDSRATRILALASEYEQAARRLLHASREIWLIDPYMKLTRPGRAKVFRSFLETVAAFGAYRIIIFARYSECVDLNNKRSLDELLHSFRGTRLCVEIHLVDDADNVNKMHARYLLSIKGALRFEKGFVEEKSSPQLVEVETVSKLIHDDLCRLYLEDQHGFKVVESIYCATLP